MTGLEDIPEEWKGILAPGERILWQGRPDSRRTRRTALLLMLLPTIVCVGMGGLMLASWGWNATVAAGWATALVVIGLGLPAAYWIVQRYRFYTLTDRRAFIGTAVPMFRRRLEQYPIHRSTELRYHGVPGSDIGTIHFAERISRGQYGKRKIGIGFEYVHDAGSVYQLVRRVKEGTA